MATTPTPFDDRAGPLADRLSRPPRRAARAGNLLPGLMLVALGGFFLFTSLVPLPGSLLFLALGAIFLAARCLTGRYGYAVPAGLLLGFGSFAVLHEIHLLPRDDGGWFFLLMGLGFLATYVIGAQPAVIWPLVPAALLGVFGLLLLGRLDPWPLVRFAWSGIYWPLALVLIGLWLLVRDRLSPATRRPVATIGLLALAGYGLLAGAAAVADHATVGAPLRAAVRSLGAPLAETVELTAPIGAGETLSVNNPNGHTTIRTGSGGEVRVVATKRFWARDEEPQARLTRGAVVTLQTVMPERGILGNAPRVDFAMEVPAGVPVEVRSGSGDVAINGLAGAVQVASGSGDVHLANLSGPVTVRTGSGDVTLAGVSGELRATSGSGSIRGTGVAQLREAGSSSGHISLSGAFTEDARIQTSSGDVTVRFAPSSSARVDVATSSGAIRTRDLALASQRQERRNLSASLGGGAGALRIYTSSGDILLDSSR